jgi:hypothetical protein
LLQTQVTYMHAFVYAILVEEIDMYFFPVFTETL